MTLYLCMCVCRYEVRSLAKQREVLEQAEKEAREKVHVAMGELSSCKTKISQVPSWRHVHICMCVGGYPACMF